MVTSVKPIVCVTEAFGLGRGVRSCGACCGASGTATRMASQIKFDLRIASRSFRYKTAEMLTLRPGDPAVLEQRPAPAAVDDLGLDVGGEPDTAWALIECPTETWM